MLAARGARKSAGSGHRRVGMGRRGAGHTAARSQGGSGQRHDDGEPPELTGCSWIHGTLAREVPRLLSVT